MPASPSSSSTQPSSSPFEPPLSPHAPLPKIIHLVDIVYPESYLRTPLPLVPSAQQHSLEQHLPSPNLSFSDTDTVRESVETDATHGYVGEVDVWGEGGGEWIGVSREQRAGKGVLKRRLSAKEEEGWTGEGKKARKDWG